MLPVLKQALFLLLSFWCLSICSVRQNGGGMRKREFINFKALPVVGRLKRSGANANAGGGSGGGGGDGSVAAAFLGPAKGMETFGVTSKRGEEAQVLVGVVPVPLLKEGAELAISDAIRAQTFSSVASAEILTDRDGGLFDELRDLYTRQEGSSSSAGLLLGKRAIKEIYNKLRVVEKGTTTTTTATSSASTTAMQKQSCYEGFVQALASVAKLEIKGLLLEVSDRPSAELLVLGGALLCEPINSPWNYKKMTSENALAFLLHTQRLASASASTVMEEPSEDICLGARDEVDCSLVDVNGLELRLFRSNDLFFVKCYADELVGLSLAPSLAALPIVLSRAVSETLSMQALLKKEKKSGELSLTAPFELNDGAGGDDNASSSSASSSGVQPTSSPSPKPEEMSATIFLKMRSEEKRAWLRAQGVSSLRIPRPREGLRALDAFVLSRLELEVVYEILRRLAESKEDRIVAADMADFYSNKPRIAKQIMVAQTKGDLQEATRLTKELESLSFLSYHPFEIYRSGTFDVERWYYEAKKTFSDTAY